MNVELTYWVIWTTIVILGILTVTRKMSIGIGIIGIGTGFIISYFLSDYMNMVMMPVSQAIFYGGVWDVSAILGIAHLISLIWMVIIAGYNLMSSGGKITWA